MRELLTRRANFSLGASEGRGGLDGEPGPVVVHVDHDRVAVADARRPAAPWPAGRRSPTGPAGAAAGRRRPGRSRRSPATPGRPSVTSSVSRRSASRRRQRGDLDVDDRGQLARCQRVEDHDVVEPVEELRLEVRRGPPPCTASRRCSSRAASGRRSACEPRFEVRIRIALRKSTVRPWPSVSRPSSSTCSRMSKTSGCAFSTSSSRTTEYGRRRTASVSWPPSSYPT